MLDVLGLAVILESVHDFWSQAALLVLLIYGKEGNLVERLVSKPSECYACNNVTVHFYDYALVDSVK